MFIIWGTRIKRRPVGRVADFCSVCHAHRAFRLLRVGAAGHLYGLSLGAGRLVGHEIVCEACDTPTQTQFERYSAVSKDKSADVEALTRETHPALEQNTLERRALEQRAATGQATAEERRDLLIEPFLLVNPMLERQQQEHSLSPRARNSAAVMFFLLATLLVVMGMSNPERSYERAAAVVGILLAGSFVTFLFFWATSTRSFVRREVEPRIVRALTPFQPTPTELEGIVGYLKDGGLASGKKLKPHKLRAAFESAARAPGQRAA